MHEYVEDNPLYAEPAAGEFDECHNLVKNVEELLLAVHDGHRTHVEAAAFVASYDQECELPLATTAMLGLTYGRNRADVVDDVAKLWVTDVG